MTTDTKFPSSLRLAIGLSALSAMASAQTCNRDCLLDQAKQFDANMLAHTGDKIPLAPDVQIRGNAKLIALAGSKWSSVKKILSEGVYADAIKENVMDT